MRCFLICWCCRCDAARLRPTGALFGGLPGLELENGRELLWLETRASDQSLWALTRAPEARIFLTPRREKGGSCCIVSCHESTRNGPGPVLFISCPTTVADYPRARAYWGRLYHSDNIIENHTVLRLRPGSPLAGPLCHGGLSRRFDTIWEEIRAVFPVDSEMHSCKIILKYVVRLWIDINWPE